MKRLCLLFSVLVLAVGVQAEEGGMDALIDKLEQSTWIAQGPSSPARKAYLFTDMACPYCAKLSENMAPLVKDPNNRLQIRHIVVGLIDPERSFTQGAAVLAADQPARALAKHEKRFDQGGIEPLATVPPELREKIQENTALMIGLGLSGTPTLVFQDRQNRWRVAQGVVSGQALRESVFQLD